MEFQRERLTNELCDEVYPLLEAHWKEIAFYKDIPLKPDFTKYIQLSDSEHLLVYTARDNDTKELIGYAAFMVAYSLHYRTSKQAVQDVIYFKPERRGHGMVFIDWCDQQLKALGCQVVYHHVKDTHNFGPALKRVGYDLVDHIYGRRLT